MLEVSWGELGVVVGVGLFMIGRKDMPSAARVAGKQVGRVVGLLQGARARADRFAANNELRQLQNELRSGLRELDAVKTELALSMSGPGRTLGATVPSANRALTQQQSSSGPRTLVPSAPTLDHLMTKKNNLTKTMATETVGSLLPNSPGASRGGAGQRSFPPVRQTIGAVAEEEWEKQGIAYKSRAEQGAGLHASVDPSTTGSALLASVMQQSLVFDQYDRVVQEQDDILQSKVNNIMEKKKRHEEAAGKDGDKN